MSNHSEMAVRYHCDIVCLFINGVSESTLKNKNVLFHSKMSTRGTGKK